MYQSSPAGNKAFLKSVNQRISLFGKGLSKFVDFTVKCAYFQVCLDNLQSPILTNLSGNQLFVYFNVKLKFQVEIYAKVEMHAFHSNQLLSFSLIIK